MQSLSYAKKRYTQGQRLGKSTKQVVFNVYSEAIAACAEGDSLRSLKALAALQLSIDPNDPSDLSDHLHQIFEYCIQLVQDEEFEVAADTLIKLRAALTT